MSMTPEGISRTSGHKGWAASRLLTACKERRAVRQLFQILLFAVFIKPLTWS